MREFLEARLRREIGDAGICDLHLRVGRWAEGRDWAGACFHYAAAGEAGELLRVLANSIEAVIGTGEIAVAADYLARFPPTETTAGFEIIRSRHAGAQMDLERALEHAQLAVALDGASDSSLGNLLATYFLTGDQGLAFDVAGKLSRHANNPIQRRVGIASLRLMAASLEGKLDDAVAALQAVREDSHRLGLIHYEGVSLLNLALLSRVQGMAEQAYSLATEAAEILARTSGGSEVVAAELAVAWAHAHLGRLDQARLALAAALERCTGTMRFEWLTEAAEIELWYGDGSVAEAYLDEAGTMTWNASLASINVITRVELALRFGDVAAAQRLLPAGSPQVPSLESGFQARCHAVAAHVALRAGDPDATAAVAAALRFATSQGTGLWAGYSQSVLATASMRIDADLRRVLSKGPVLVSMVAELWIAQLCRLNQESAREIASEVERRPGRWRDSLRRCVADAHDPNRVHAARILDLVGERVDIPILRGVARASRMSPSDKYLGRGLARRLADPVLIEDQGRVEIRVGAGAIAGTDLRRKVLAMLCFLLSRPKFAATRDEVVDALWPDLSPEVAVNSLNQTVYFLRRVFEPEYKEDHSAGYVIHDSDVLWLDGTLISSRSRQCRDLIDRLGPDPSPSDVERLSELYQGRFALDFSYEEWAGPYRDALHVGYLQVIEAAVNRDMEAGHYDRAIRLARRALDVDPDQESLELTLLRLYRVTGAHSAAAEQYAHYSAYVRDELGLDPPPLASL